MEITTSAVLLIVTFLATTQWRKIDANEPVCTSRFDFESKLLSKMIQVEFDMAQLKDRTREALSELDKCTLALKDEQASKLEEITTLGNELRREAETMKQSVEDTRALLPKQFADLENELGKTKESVSTDLAVLVKEFEEKTDAKWKNIEAQATKPAVAFVAKEVSDTSPGTNAMLKFTQKVFNTGSAYDTQSGYFTAPVGGTYWFSVQMCPEYQKYLHVEIRVGGSVVVASSVLYDSSGAYPGSTVSAVAVLAAGSKVSVYSGISSSSSGTIIKDDSSRWASFSGALVD